MAKTMFYLYLKLIFTRFLVPLPEKQPHSIMLPPPCLTVGNVFFGLKASPFFRQTYATSLWPKSSIFISSDQRIDDQNASSLSRWLWANFRRDLVWLGLRSGVFRGRRPFSPALFNVLWRVCLEMLVPLSSRPFNISLVVIRGLIVAARTNILACLAETLGFLPGLFRFFAVSNILNFFMMLWTVVTCTWKRLDIAL